MRSQLPDTARVLDAGRRLARWVRRPRTVGRRGDDRAGIEDAEAILHARRVAHGAAGRVRAGLLAENEAGLERLAEPRLDRDRGVRRGSSAATRSTGSPSAIWGQFNHALG